MGHRRKSFPRRGTRAYSPRVRARRESARWRNWPNSESGKPELQGFAGYKVGMTHIVAEESRKRHKLYKQERVMPVTIIETPKVSIYGIRAYTKSYRSIKVLGEVWGERFDRHLKRTIFVPNKKQDERKWTVEKLKSVTAKICGIRILAHTNPVQAGFPRKKPDILEIPINGGSIKEQIEYAETLLGTDVSFADRFEEGNFIDVTSTTTGKGFQGVIKRWGVKILPRKTRKGRRVVGCIGPWHPARVSWRVPRAGKAGYHPRTEYNKRIMKISDIGREITPDKGFKRYGSVKSAYILLKGSVPGPTKRLIRMRNPIRRSSKPSSGMEPVKISFISSSYNKKKTTTEA